MPIRTLPWIGIALLLTLTAVGVEAQQCCFVTVAKLTRIATGWVGEELYLNVDSPTHDNSCHDKDQLFMDRSSKQFQETVAIATLSFAQARPIDVFYDGSCVGGSVKLFAVAMRTNP